MRQNSLFPDDYEVHERALAALRELDVATAVRHVQQAREREAQLVDLVDLELALTWMSLQPHSSHADRVQLLARVAHAGLAGELTAVAGTIVDEAVTRFLLRTPPAGAFTDAAERLPWAALLMLARRPEPVREPLAELVRARPERGDLWYWYGNACWFDQRRDEAVAAWVRGALLDPDAFDWWRVADRRLLDACKLARQDGAADLAFAVAWRQGLLPIRPGNGWLSPTQIELRLQATAAQPHRQFCLLLYQDRSAGAGSASLDRRMTMAELAPAEFERFMTACRRSEHGRAGA